MIFIILFVFGISSFSFLNRDIIQTKIPHITKRKAANIKISGTDEELIRKTSYPIFITGKREAPKAAAIKARIIVQYFTESLIKSSFLPDG